MGISSNQARLMTLTARQHDLELRAQQISAGKMITSLQSQQYATAYSTALNNYATMKQDASKITDISNTQKYKISNGTIVKDNSAGTLTSKSALDSAVESYLTSAKATYDAAVASLSSQEKLLDLELTQLNTEHSAVKTEYDSVKGLVSENTDKSFNVFG